MKTLRETFQEGTMEFFFKFLFSIVLVMVVVVRVVAELGEGGEGGRESWLEGEGGVERESVGKGFGEWDW